tara:strand:- start:2393 stop:3703 length:1311 start_codon:yes stop_codon:yes gene_type:complete
MFKLRENYNYLFFLLITLSILSFFFGFSIDENSAGGGKGDFGNTWKNLQTFKNNSLLDALKITSLGDSSTFQSSRLPGVYIFHKFLNPFTENTLQFRLSVFIFSLLVPISFYYALKINLKKIKPIYAMLISSLIFLSPYFRTSAIWGNEENFGLLTLILSYIFLQLYLKEKLIFKNFIFLNLLCLFSSLCVYFDQKLSFVPAICFFSIMINAKKNLDKFYSATIYFIFALPVFYFFYIWDGIMPPVDAESRGVLKGNLYFQHIGYSMSIIAFYLAPLILLIKNIFKFNLRYFLSKELLWIYFSIFIYIVYFIFFYEINSEIFLGKGVFFKLSEILFDKSFIQKIFLCFVFVLSCLLILVVSNSKYNNIFIFLFLILLSIIYWPVLQEYFDPLILILFFTFLNNQIEVNEKSISFIFIFFSFFLVFSNFYYSFTINY